MERVGLRSYGAPAGLGNYGVVLFHTTSSAMRAEKTLLRNG